MDGQTKIVWDFLHLAYRTGSLDRFMQLSRAAVDKRYENQATVFAKLEDAISEMDDFSSVDQTLEEIFRQMPVLSDEETLEGLGTLVSIVTPLIESAMESVDRDTQVLKDKGDKLFDDLPKMAKAVFMVLVLNSDSLVSALGRRPARQYGRDLGRGLNAMASFINNINDRSPSAIPDFMSGAFSAVDGNEVSKMLDTVTHAFLDRKPPLLKWTASTMLKRARKKVVK